jgi:hypothetical protein
MADFSSLFSGGPQPQGSGMFGVGAQPQSPLMQMLGGGAGGGNPQQLMQLAQMLLAQGNPTAAPQGMGAIGSMLGGMTPQPPQMPPQPTMMGNMPGLGQQPNQMGLPPQLLQMLMQQPPGSAF